MKKISAKKLDSLIDEIFRRRCSGVSIDIMDIPKIFKSATAIFESSGGDVVAMEAAIVEFVNLIRKDK